MGVHIIIIEIDENKRLMEISQNLGHLSIVFIIFNPYDYIDSNGKKIKSCWIPNNKTNILYIPKTKQTEWNKRLDVLKNQIQYWIDNKTYKTIEIIQLFYDKMFM